MHRFAISSGRPTPPQPVSPPTRFGSSDHDPTSFPDPSPPPAPRHPPTRNLSLNSSRSSTFSLDSGYPSTITTYPPPSGPPSASLPPGEIEPGIYEIKSHVWGSVIDSNAGDRKSVIAFSPHGQANQQWEFTQLGKGWSVRNVATGLFLTVEKGIGHGVPLVASEFPVAWEVQVDNLSSGFVRILWPHSEATWDMPSNHDGTPIQLSNRYSQDAQDRKLWLLVPAAKTMQSPVSMGVMPEPDTPHRDHHHQHHHHHHRHRGGHGRGHGHGSGPSHGISSTEWSSDSDSDASYTIVKSITKTKRVSKSKGKNSKPKGTAK